MLVTRNVMDLRSLIATERFFSALTGLEPAPSLSVTIVPPTRLYLLALVRYVPGIHFSSSSAHRCRTATATSWPRLLRRKNMEGLNITLISYLRTTMLWQLRLQLVYIIEESHSLR